MEAAPAAIADMESPHDANALELSPNTTIMQAANLTKFKVRVDFIALSSWKVGGHLATGETNLCIAILLIRVGTYRPEAAMPQCKLDHLSDIFGTPGKVLIASVL